MKETVAGSLRVVAVSGGLGQPSRASSLAEHLLDLVAQHLPSERHLVQLGRLAPHFAGAAGRSQLPETVERELAAVESADVLIVSTPVYRSAYTGLFKHFFDFVDQDALIDTPILLAATGGSERHALMIEHQLRPLFSFFQACTLPLGVYATDKDFLDYRLHDEGLLRRAELAVKRAMPLLQSASHRQTRRTAKDVVAA